MYTQTIMAISAVRISVVLSERRQWLLCQVPSEALRNSGLQASYWWIFQMRNSWLSPIPQTLPRTLNMGNMGLR
jgi:hypothetical protein